jgi:hypothetical protein
VAGAVYGVRIDVLNHELAELGDVGVRLGPVLRRLLRVGMDQVQAEVAEEKLADEAGRGPFGLARRLGDLARLLLAGCGPAVLGTHHTILVAGLGSRAAQV